MTWHHSSSRKLPCACMTTALPATHWHPSQCICYVNGRGAFLWQAPLAFRGRKANLRGEYARNAVRNNYKPPPSSTDKVERQQGSTQLKVTDLFGRHFVQHQQQQWQLPVADALHASVQDMEV